MVGGAQKEVTLYFSRMHQQGSAGHEFFEVVAHDGASGQPLAVQLAPHGLGPAGLRDRQVQPAVLAAQPVHRGLDVAQRVGAVQQHHLGHAAGAGGEVDEQRIVVFVQRQRALEVRPCFCHLLVEGEPALPPPAGGDAQLQRGALGQRQVQLLRERAVGGADDRGDVRRVGAVDDVLLGQKVGRGHGDGAQACAAP